MGLTVAHCHDKCTYTMSERVFCSAVSLSGTDLIDTLCRQQCVHMPTTENEFWKENEVENDFDGGIQY